MTDRELLKLAAKAAGYSVEWVERRVARIGAFKQLQHERRDGFVMDGKEWNPLEDDGAALRLLCKRSMRIVEDHGGACRAVQFTLHPETDEEAEHEIEIEIEWPHTPAATRRAITRAAAEIGKAMP